MTDRPAYHDDLDATLAESWRLLAAGEEERRSAFHTPALATLGLDGRPRLRTVVLRGADAPTRSVRFHCDRRSQKLAEIGRDRRVGLHVYDAPAKLQLRLEGLAAVHVDDGVAAEVWTASRPMSRATYAVSPGPGTVIAAGGAYATPGTDADRDGGRANFAAVTVEARVVEFLSLAHEGHRRARFTWTGDAWLSEWLVP